MGAGGSAERTSLNFEGRACGVCQKSGTKFKKVGFYFYKSTAKKSLASSLISPLTSLLIQPLPIHVSNEWKEERIWF